MPPSSRNQKKKKNNNPPAEITRSNIPDNLPARITRSNASSAVDIPDNLHVGTRKRKRQPPPPPPLQVPAEVKEEEEEEEEEPIVIPEIKIEPVSPVDYYIEPPPPPVNPPHASSSSSSSSAAPPANTPYEIIDLTNDEVITAAAAVAVIHPEVINLLEEDNIYNANILNAYADRKKPLTQEQINKVGKAFRSGPPGDILADKFDIKITRDIFHRLKPGTWIDDKIIDFYMQLLNARELKLREQNIPGRRTSRFFDPHFLGAAIDPITKTYSYEKIKRYTRKYYRNTPHLFEIDKLFFPVNYSNSHWVMMVIYPKEKRFELLDSLYYKEGYSARRLFFMNLCFNWLIDEQKDKLNIVDERKNWTYHQRVEGEIPLQYNDIDCGVFSILYASYLADDLDPLMFDHGDINFFRRKIAAAILEGKLDY